MQGNATDWESCYRRLLGDARGMRVTVSLGTPSDPRDRALIEMGHPIIAWARPRTRRIDISIPSVDSPDWELLSSTLAHELGHFEQDDSGFPPEAYVGPTKVDIECDAWHKAMIRLGSLGMPWTRRISEDAIRCLKTYLHDGWNPYAGDTLETMEV